MRRTVFQWEPRNDRKPPPKRSWLRKAIAPVIIAGLFALGVFVVIPHFWLAHYRDELAAVNALAEKGPIEDAITKYEALKAEAKGTEVAEAAERERARLAPIAAAAGDRMLQAYDAFRKKDYEGALKLYREIAAQFPLSERASEAIAEEPLCVKSACDALAPQITAATAEKRWGPAKTLCEKILSLDPNNADAKAGLQEAVAKIAEARQLVEAGQAAENSGDMSKASAFYTQALAVETDAPGALEARNRVLHRIPPPEGMTLILPGEFTVGDAAVPSEPTVRKLQSNGFYMDITEVTNAQYAKFVAETSHPPPPSWRGNKPAEEILELPVVCVSWDDAAAYAAWAGKRLPTAIEWERAARGPDGRKYPWGDSFQPSAGAFSRAPSPVGRMTADKSEEGCMDMGGNVSEWVADDVPSPTAIPYHPPISPHHHPAGFPEPPPPEPISPYKAVRGTSWAGLERDRPERVVPDNFATATTDPVKTVLVDKPGVRGLEISATAETEFFFVGVRDELPLILMRQWSPELKRVVVASFRIRPGEKIAGERTFSSGPGKSVRVQFDSGCRLLSADDVLLPSKARIRYADADGREFVMQCVRRSESDLLRTPRISSDNWDEDVYQAVVAEISARSLADAAQSACRLCAPKDGRYINCGFRCAKDVP